MSEPDRLPAETPDVLDAKPSRESAIRSVVESLLERDDKGAHPQESPSVSGSWSATAVEGARPSRVLLVFVDPGCAHAGPEVVGVDDAAEILLDSFFASDQSAGERMQSSDADTRLSRMVVVVEVAYLQEVIAFVKKTYADELIHRHVG